MKYYGKLSFSCAKVEQNKLTSVKIEILVIFIGLMQSDKKTGTVGISLSKAF